MTYETGTMNKTYRKVIVPTADEIAEYSDQQLLALRSDLTDAKLAIENQLFAAQTAGNLDHEWLIRTNGALSHMRRGLALVKQERERRSVVPKMPDDLNPAFAAIDTLRDVLKAYGTLVEAVRQFLDDDNDSNFDLLEQLVTR